MRGEATHSRLADRQGRLHGCFAASGGAQGTLRVVGPRSRCRRGERAILWSQRGSAGPVGPAGPAGRAGAAGTNATIAGVAAGGALAGTYPNPSIAARAVGARQLADGAVAPRHWAQVPAVRATGRPFTSVPNSAGTTLPFDDTISRAPFAFDDDGMHDATGPNPERLTARTAGTYLVYGVVNWVRNATGTRTLRLVQHLANGGSQDTVMSEVAAAPSSSTTQNAVRLVQMAAGDYLTLTGIQDSGAPLNAFPLDFGAVWVGP